MKLPDYNLIYLYVMYIALICASLIGAYLKVFSADVAIFTFTSVLGHFFGVLTPNPTTRVPPEEKLP